MVDRVPTVSVIRLTTNGKESRIRAWSIYLLVLLDKAVLKNQEDGKIIIPEMVQFEQ